MEIVVRKLQQAEAQLAYWREQTAAAGRQAAMWEGAVEALRGVLEEGRGELGITNDELGIGSSEEQGEG